MSEAGLCVLVTPSAPGTAWREALIARAEQLGWAISDTEASMHPDPANQLVFVYHHGAMQAFPASARVVIADTTATELLDPGQPATAGTITARSHALVEAEMAASEGAVVLNAARYTLEFPGMGPVTRREGEPYRIHPSASESPLAFFDDPAPGSSVEWRPRWFSYPQGYDGEIDAPQLDMTGRMRPLVAGPAIWLPAGRWRVDVRFTVDPEKAHAPLLFEWGSGIEYSRLVTEIRHRGAYSTSLDRIWHAPASAELRIWPAHPVFQGSFGFQGARLTRLALDDPSPVTPTDRIVEAPVL